jgi:hypothetical protein
MENKNDEISILYLFHSLKKGFLKLAINGFNVLNFIAKNWKTFVLLVVLGVVLGYFLNLDYKESKSAKVLLRINHDAVNFVYNEINFLNEKIAENDKAFFKAIGFESSEVPIKDLEIKPIIDLTEISRRYEVNDRNLEGLLRNLDFNTIDLEISETFISKYKNHTLNLNLSTSADDKTITDLISYFNDNPLLQKLKDTTLKDVKKHIKLNTKSIIQIERIIENYSQNRSLPSESDQIYVVDKNFSVHGLLIKKTELQKESESLNKFLVNESEVVVMVNRPNVIKKKRGLLGNPMIKYPIMLVLAFLVLVFLRNSYFNLKELAESSENN